MAKKINLFIILIISIIFLSHIYASESDDLIKEAVDMINQKSYEKAILVLKKAIGQNKSNGIAYFLLGDTYQYEKNYKEAIKNYKKSIEIKPDFGDAYYNVACAYYSTGNTNSAVKWLDRAKNIFYKQEQYKKYENILEKLISLTTGDIKENYQSEMERYIFSNHNSTHITPAPNPSVPTVAPSFPLIEGTEIPGESPYALSINDTPYDEILIYNYNTKKLYAPAEDFTKKIGLKGYYDFTKGKFMVNNIILPDEFITMDKYQTLYLSVLDVIIYLKVSYMYNEFLNRPVIIVKPSGLNYLPGQYPTPIFYPTNSPDNGYKNYNLTPYPTPNW